MLAELAAGLRESRGVAHKRDIAPLVSALSAGAAWTPGTAKQRVAIGDDCAAIPDDGGYLLLAIEGFLNEFVAADPWFAGYCGVMVNLSDIYAMGGRPIAVVDALWCRGTDRGRTVLEGMAAASSVYQVPIVGGHSNARSDRDQLAVAVLGRATQLLSSFDAKPGDALLAAIDLRGRFREPHAHWDASTGADAARLRADLEILPRLAEDGLCRAAKDISMAGVIGTAIMLLECSGAGAVMDVEAVPAPPGVAPGRWLLSTFPSYGFILSVAPRDTDAVAARFRDRGIACAVVGRCDDTRAVRLSHRGDALQVWDLAASPFIGCGPGTQR